MCGFAGLLNNAFPVRQRQLAAIAAAVCFRGPNNCGIRFYDQHLHAGEEGNNAMFFNRLAIMDLDPDQISLLKTNAYPVIQWRDL